jgi:hypothetical protein
VQAADSAISKIKSKANSSVNPSANPSTTEDLQKPIVSDHGSESNGEVGTVQKEYKFNVWLQQKANRHIDANKTPKGIANDGDARRALWTEFEEEEEKIKQQRVPTGQMPALSKSIFFAISLSISLV